MSLPSLVRGAAATFVLLSLTACGNIGPLYLPDDPHPPIHVPARPRAADAVPAEAGSMSRPAQADPADGPV